MHKKLILTVVAFCFAGLINQSIGQLNIGGGLFYGTYLDNVGLDLRAEYHITDELILAPKLDLSFPDIPFGPTFLNELCLHAHYQVFKEDNINLYPLVGVCFKNYIDFDSEPFDMDFHLGMGLSFGAGGQLKISDGMSMFAEARYSTGHYHQLVFTGGLIMTREKTKD